MKYQKMKPIWKKKWLKALRSGKFAQGGGSLCRDDDTGATSFCCLGVLAHLDTDEDWKSHWSGEYSLDGDHGELTPRYRDKYGLNMDSCKRLVNLNDTMEWSFKRIATWIEKHL